MIAGDQAAGLRAWAQQEGRDPAASREAPADPAPAVAPPPTTTTLVVVGLPGTSTRQVERVSVLLEHWADQGRRWVGDPRGWKVVPLAVTSPHLGVLAEQQKRWALWVDADAEAFRRAMAVLSRLVAGGGPRRLLAVHPPDLPRQGLLENLRQAARHYLGVDLLVMA
ncbi:hypothetical protein ACFPTY_16480 [Halomonas beimenensis]|uniref:Uncharacterized protein n=1 Tax=Halomonas beimenensis TaxID=475662 RepID=A0A291PCL3_9GAMM|nr:hypothetical protein [Halomonas beimenensis]ATJ84620.1 hypothetical protein BEI_3633 [Halomonas beimenensis]